MILVADHGWPFLATLPVAGALGFIVGFVIGIPALRIRGLYLSLITLGLALAFPAIAKSDNFFGFDFASLTGGSNGKVDERRRRSPRSRGSAGRHRRGRRATGPTNDWIFTTVLVIAIVLFFLTSNLIRSRVGRGLVAMRDNETGAAVSGVYPAQYKVLAFATSALVTAVGGGCFALAANDIGPDTFGLQRSIEFIAGLVIGGVATILGPAIGGMLVEWLPYWAFEIDWPDRSAGSTARRPGSSTALLLVLIIFFMPGGDRLRAALAAFEVRVIVPRLPASKLQEQAIIEQSRPVPRSSEPVRHSNNHKGEPVHENEIQAVQQALAGAVCLTLVAAACGGDDDAGGGDTTAACLSLVDAACGGDDDDDAGRRGHRRATATEATTATARPGHDETAATDGTTAAATGDHRQRTRPPPPTRPRHRTSRRRRRAARRSRSPPTTARPTATEAAAPTASRSRSRFIGPQTGPLAAFGVIGQGMQVYFDKINEEGGIDGHQLELVTKDDAYDPAKSGPAVQEAIEGDEIFASVFQVGTPNVGRHPAAATPTPACRRRWSAPASRPGATRRTGRGRPAASRRTPSSRQVWTEFIKEKFPDATKVAMLSFNNDFGKTYQTALQRARCPRPGWRSSPTSCTSRRRT